MEQKIFKIFKNLKSDIVSVNSQLKSHIIDSNVSNEESEASDKQSMNLDQLLLMDHTKLASTIFQM